MISQRVSVSAALALARVYVTAITSHHITSLPPPPFPSLPSRPCSKATALHPRASSTGERNQGSYVRYLRYISDKGLCRRLVTSRSRPQHGPHPSVSRARDLARLVCFNPALNILVSLFFSGSTRGAYWIPMNYRRHSAKDPSTVPRVEFHSIVYERDPGCKR